MDFDLGSLFTLVVFMCLPACVVVVIYAVIFVRRGKRKRQRITSRSHRHREAPRAKDADE